MQSPQERLDTPDPTPPTAAVEGPAEQVAVIAGGSAVKASALAARLPDLAEALLLLALEATSVTLTLWSLFYFDSLKAYLLDNQLTRGERTGLLLAVFGGAAGAVVIAGVSLVWGRTRLATLKRLAWRLSPLLVSAALPLLLHWQFWANRQLLLLVLAGVVVLGFRKLWLVSLCVAREAPGGRFAEFADAVVTVYRKRVPERLRRALPTAVAWAAALGYAAYFSHHTVVNHYKLQTSAFDLALEENLIWNLLHGGPAFKSSPLGGPDAVHFSFHATLFSYLLVPFYAIYQHPETLLVIQAVIMGFGALTLYWLARTLVGPWPAALLAVAYSLNASVQGSNLYDFHYPPLAPPFLFLAWYALRKRRDVLAAIAVALTLTIREDVSAYVCILGAYFFFWGRRPQAGLLLALVGGGYFAAMKFFIMPLFGHSDTHLFMFKDLLPGKEQSFSGVLKTVITNPIYTLSTLLTEKKLIFALQLLVPFALLPFKRFVGWFLCLPGFFFTLLTTQYDPTISLGFQYTAHWNAFLFPATAIILAEEQHPQHPGDMLGALRKRAWLGAIALGSLIISYQYGILFQRHFARAGFDSVLSGFSDKEKKKLDTLRAIIATIPRSAKVVASERLLPHMADRPDAYRLQHSLYDAEYILIDKTNLIGDERKNVIAGLKKGEYGVTVIRGDFVLAKRGAPTKRNEEWQKKR